MVVFLARYLTPLFSQRRYSSVKRTSVGNRKIVTAGLIPGSGIASLYLSKETSDFSMGNSISQLLIINATDVGSSLPRICVC